MLDLLEYWSKWNTEATLRYFDYDRLNITSVVVIAFIEELYVQSPNLKAEQLARFLPALASNYYDESDPFLINDILTVVNSMPKDSEICDIIDKIPDLEA